MASEDIKTLEYIGNAPSPPVYFIQGVADNPSITAGKTVLQVTCDGKVSGTGIKREVITPYIAATLGNSPSGTQKVDYVPIETTSSFGAHVTNSTYDYLQYSNLKLNKERLSGFISCKLPTLSSGIVGLFKFYSGTQHHFEVRRDSQDKIYLHLKISNATKTPQDEYVDELATAGYHTIGFWYDSGGVLDEKDGTTYYSKILIDGEIAWSTTDGFDCPAFTSSLTHLQINANPSHGSLPGLTLKDIAVFNHALSDEALREMHFSDTAKNNNNTLNYNAALASGDVIRYNSRDTSSELFDSSLGAKLNCYSTFSGNAPLLYGDDNEKDDIYVTTSTGTINQLNVTYQPHFR